MKCTRCNGNQRVLDSGIFTKICPTCDGTGSMKRDNSDLSVCCHMPVTLDMDSCTNVCSKCGDSCLIENPELVE